MKDYIVLRDASDFAKQFDTLDQIVDFLKQKLKGKFNLSKGYFVLKARVDDRDVQSQKFYKMVFFITNMEDVENFKERMV